MPFLLKDKTIIIILAILFIAIVAIPKMFYPDLDHGDEFSDASILMSGKNFIKFGFIKCRFLPVFEPHLDKPVNPYTHAPPLSDIMNGFLRLVFKTDSLRFFRAVALLFSLLSLLFWYLFIRKFTNSYLVSFLAALFYFSNPSFIYGADSLYQNAYADFFRVFIFYIYINIIGMASRRKVGLFILFLAIIIETLFTFEYIAYLSLFFIIFGIFYRSTEVKRFPKRYIFLILLVPLVSIALHFLQNAWYFGSFSQAFQDLKKIALERITSSKDSPLVLNLSTWWQHVFSRYFSLAFIFNSYILFSFVFFIFLLYKDISPQSKREVRRIFYLFLLLFSCGVSWYFIFPSHALAHTFILFLVRHLVPAASLAFALFCFIIYLFIKENNPRNLGGKFVLGILAVVIASTGILNSELPVTRENIARAKDFLVFKEPLLKLRKMENGNAPIGVNYYRYPFIRYYTNQQCQTIFNKESLEKASVLPRYFILILYGAPDVQLLMQALNDKYTTLFKCDSGRFPSVFYKLKE